MKKALLQAALLLSAGTLCLQAQITNIQQGLVSYWPMDSTFTSNSQTYTADLVQGNNLLVLGSATFVPGQFGNAVSNNGASYEVFIPATPGTTGLPITMNPGTNFSILFWANGVNSSGARVFAEAQQTNSTPINSVDVTQASPSGAVQTFNRIYSTNTGGAQQPTVNGNTVVFNGTWHHLAWVVSNATQTLYVDGTNQGSTSYYYPSVTANPTNLLNDTTVGALLRSTTVTGSSAGSYFKGDVDDLAVWNRALSQAEVKNVMSNSLGANIQAFGPYFNPAPAGGSVPSCGNLTLTGVANDGATPLSAAGFSYQWQEDGTNATAAEFSGATSTALTITGAGAQDGGTYTLIASFVTNSVANSITSAPVVVTVVTNPTFTLTAGGTSNLWPGDNWNLGFSVQAPCGGVTSYEWVQNGTYVLQDNGDIQNSSTANVSFVGIDPTNSGTYSLVAFFNGGASSATSAPVMISVNAFSSSGSTPNLTNGLIAYWPLYAVQGTKTPDVLNGYDLNVVGTLSNTTDHTGSTTNAMYFNGSSYCWRQDGPTDLLPAIQYPTFTTAFWVQAVSGSGAGQNGNPVGPFSEGSSQNSGPFYLLDVNLTGAYPLHVYYRFSGGNNGYPNATVSPVFDGNWHHVVYVQRPYGTNFPGPVPFGNSVNPSNVLSEVYVDGSLDPEAPSYEPWPLTNANATIMNEECVGALYRAGAANYLLFGAVSDVAQWNRVLSPAEVSQLYSTGMPAVTPNIPPMSISSFVADGPEVRQGGAMTLAWNVSAYATQISIDQGVGSVFSNSSGGVGSVVVSNVQQTRTYTLTVSRGTNVVTAQVKVGVLSGINTGWKPLDTFDEYPTGPLQPAAFPWWGGSSGSCFLVEGAGGNQLLQAGTQSDFTSDYSAYPAPVFHLQGNSVTLNQAVTLFFRFATGNDIMDSTGTNVVTAVDENIGLSDYVGIRWYGDTTTDVGPDVFLGTDSLVFAIGAQNGFGSATTWATGANAVLQPDGTPLVLSNNTVYDVWVDVTNTDFTIPAPATYSIWIAPENNLSNQTLVFSNYLSNRDPIPGAGTGHPLETQNMTVVFTGGFSADSNNIAQISLDDFYINTNGYNHTVPRPFGLTTEQGLAPVVSQTVLSNGQIRLYWSGGALASAPALTGPWTPLAGGTTNVPYYLVTPTSQQMFFRTQ